MCLPFSLCWKLLETLSLKGGGDSKLPAVLHVRQPSRSFRSCSSRSYPPVVAVTSVRSLHSVAGSQGPGAVSPAAFHKVGVFSQIQRHPCQSDPKTPLPVLPNPGVGEVRGVPSRRRSPWAQSENLLLFVRIINPHAFPGEVNILWNRFRSPRLRFCPKPDCGKQWLAQCCCQGCWSSPSLQP